MINERLGSLFKSQEEQERLSFYKDKIYQGLDLQGAGFLKLSKDIENRLVNDFAKTLIATSAHLKKSVPEVGLIHGWNQPLEGYEKNHEIREILANAYSDENYPHGVIDFSPFYLKAEITYRMGIDQKPVFPFEYLLAHEDFHVWQFLNQYEKVIEDCRVFKTDGLAAWNQTQTEIDANEFANLWIKNHKFII